VATVVAIEQDYDEATACAQRVREDLVYSHEAFRHPGGRHTLVRCFNDRATLSEVAAALTDPAVGFVTGVGHGSYTRFTGQHGVVLLDALHLPVQYVRGKIIHLLSCQTGGILGLMCVQNGALAFWGYSVDFVFPVGSDDAATRAFLQMDALIDRGILGGRSADEIYDAVTRHFWDVYAQLVDRGSPWAAELLDDYVHLVCPALSWGSPTATL
jgi:hypothetical protein